MGAAGFWRLDAAADLSDWAHQHQYESRKWWAKSRIPGPGCPADGYKMVLCLCPAKAAHNCCPIRSLLAGGPRNSNLCPQQSRIKNVHGEVRGTAIYDHSNREKNIRGEVRGTAIYVHSNPEKNIHGEVQRTAIYVHINPQKCPWRGPRNSNLCPQQSWIMSMARAEEQQYMSTTIQKNVHSEVRRTAIIQQSRKQLSMAYIQMTSEESAKLRCVEMMYRINWKIRQKQQQKPLSEKVSIQF